MSKRFKVGDVAMITKTFINKEGTDSPSFDHNIGKYCKITEIEIDLAYLWDYQVEIQEGPPDTRQEFYMNDKCLSPITELGKAIYE